MSALRRILPSTRRHFSSSPAAAAILSTDAPNAVQTSSEKTRSVLSFLKSETNPDRILDICRAASLNPDHRLDRIALSIAVERLSKTNNFSSIKEYIDELSSSRPDLRSERFVSHAIVLYGQANMINDAIELYKSIDELGLGRSVRSFNALLFACIWSKEFNEMKRVFLDFPRMYKVNPDLVSYNTVIKGFGESGSVNSVWSILAEMDRKGIKPNATSFGNALSGFYREEKLEDVGKLVNLMKEKYEMKQGVGVYNVRIQGLCKLGRSEEARALMDGMMERGIKPNTDTFRNLIHGYCKEEKYEEAKELFKKMMDRGCQPDSECYFNLVYYLCKGGHFKSALNYCEESMEKGWVPNFGVMKSLVMGLVAENMIEEAKEITARMKAKFPGKVGLWEEVETAFTI